MENQNLNFLQDNLKYLGFGEKSLLNEELAEAVTRDVESFQLYTTGIFDDTTKVEATLHFIRSGSGDRYYLRKYDALLCYPDKEEMNRAQTIFVFKGRGFTFKETFNLLQGRAVYKELQDFDEERYNAWSQLDFTEKTRQNNFRIREYKDNWGFDLVKAVECYSFLELQNEELKAELIRALQRGNLRQVTLMKKNRREKVFIAANPKEKIITIYPQASRAAHSKKGSGTDLPALPGPDTPLPPPTEEDAEDVIDDIIPLSIAN